MKQFVFLLLVLLLIPGHHNVSAKSPTLKYLFQKPAFSLRGGQEENDTDNNNINSNNTAEEMKSCRCVLCGQEIIASCQADCEAHMAVCPAFSRVHPENGETNPQGVYPPSQSQDTTTTIQEPQESKAIEEMSIKELRRIIRQSGLSDSDCIEKQDLQNRARESMQKQN